MAHPCRSGRRSDYLPGLRAVDLEAAETHHRVHRIVDGADADWASWYADWLVNLSELPSLVGSKPVRSELTYLLVGLDKDYTATQPGQPWESYYARKIRDHFSRPSG
jgi:hypothetical protein